ncbi:MAG: hypothetical protein KAJ73_00600 [Zetaproteobacteria bacterium]|nr:hypothetical protein [Zetaproteobacteria bacterium]
MARKRVRKRKRPLSGSSTSESTQTYGDVGEADDELIDDDLSLNEAAAQEEDSSTTDGGFTAQGAKDVVCREGTGRYDKEYRMRMLHRMLMRQIPLTQIADELNVSTRTIMRDRKELFTRLRDEASHIDLNNLIGDTIGFYQEVQGMSLRAASNVKTAMNIRLAAMRTALSSRNDQHRFLSAAGVFDVLAFKSGQDEDNNDIAKLMEMTKQIMNGEEDTYDSNSLNEDEAEEEQEIRMF